MTCISKTGFVVRILALFASVAGTLSVTNGPVLAAPPSTPPGTIFYSTGGIFYAVKADGTGKTSNLLPNIQSLYGNVLAQANPSDRPYGTNAIQDRWWIIPLPTGETYDNWVYPASGRVTHQVAHWDLFAVRSNPQNRSQLVTIRLTDLYGVVQFYPGSGFWSNDSNDDNTNSFVGCRWVGDLRNAFVVNQDGTTTVDNSQVVTSTARLPLTAPEIQAGWQFNDFVPISPDSVSEEELGSMLWPQLPQIRYDGQGMISPSGNFCLMTPPDGKKLEIMDWTNPASGNPPTVLWDGTSTAPSGFVNSLSQWSPDGLTIAIGEQVSSLPAGMRQGGNIWTIPATGGTPKKVLSSVGGSSAITYGNPIWSPDNKCLVVLKQKFSGTTLTGAWITLLTLSTGKTTDLVPVSTTAGVSTFVQRWVADN